MACSKPNDCPLTLLIVDGRDDLADAFGRDDAVTRSRMTIDYVKVEYLPRHTQPTILG